MKCKFEHDGDCCNSGATQYMCKCKQPCDTISPITNAEYIRAMSDEELASWLAKTQIDNIAGTLKIARVPWNTHPDLQEAVAKDCLEWLKQPAEPPTDKKKLPPEATQHFESRFERMEIPKEEQP